MASCAPDPIAVTLAGPPRTGPVSENGCEDAPNRQILFLRLDTLSNPCYIARVVSLRFVLGLVAFYRSGPTGPYTNRPDRLAGTVVSKRKTATWH